MEKLLHLSLFSCEILWINLFYQILIMDWNVTIENFVRYVFVLIVIIAAYVFSLSLFVAALMCPLPLLFSEILCECLRH